MLACEVKKYLRISHTKDDNYIKQLITVAKSFIKEQTGVEYSKKDATYGQAVLFLVSHLYDNRTPISEKAVNTVPYTLDALIKHIRIRGAL